MWQNERRTSSRVFFRPSLNDSSRKKGSGQGEGEDGGIKGNGLIWDENSVETRRSPGNRDFAEGLTSALPVKPPRIVPLQRFPFVRSRAHTKLPSPPLPPSNLFIRCSDSRIDETPRGRPIQLSTHRTPFFSNPLKLFFFFFTILTRPREFELLNRSSAILKCERSLIFDYTREIEKKEK